MAQRKNFLFPGAAKCEGPIAMPEFSGNFPLFSDPDESPARALGPKPTSFEMIMQSFRMATMIEPVDGVKVDFGMGLSPRFQFSNSWTLPTGQPGSYDMTLVFVGGKLPTSQFEMSQPNPLIMSRFTPSAGRQEVKVFGHPTENLELRMTGSFMSTNLQESQVQLEADYSGDDYVAGAKLGLNLEFFSYHYTQSLTRNLVFGFELMNMMKNQQLLGLSYGGKYTSGFNQYFMQYLVYAKSLTLGTLLRGNKNVDFFTELTYNSMTGDADFVSGFIVKFMKARFQGQVSGAGKLTASCMHAINPFVKLTINGEADLVKQDQKFGISVSFGAG